MLISQNLVDHQNTVRDNKVAIARAIGAAISYIAEVSARRLPQPLLEQPGW